MDNEGVTMSIDINGFEYWPSALNSEKIAEIKDDIESLNQTIPRYGIRQIHNLLPSVDKLTKSKSLIQKAENLLGGKASLVRAILFDKSPDKNWFVPWHQDTTVAVHQKVDVKGWSHWTLKRGIHHVQPPIEILKKMITIRIHLDESNIDNGCLKFIERSHDKKLSSEEVNSKIQQGYKDCIMSAGDAFIMRPLLLHSSNKSHSEKSRQVIHIEYASAELPDELEWVKSLN
jgi:ectoine hydroxylase-related dioxygenase (phytanoyl-CoA dioxygenase family)